MYNGCNFSLFLRSKNSFCFPLSLNNCNDGFVGIF